LKEAETPELSEQPKRQFGVIISTTKSTSKPNRSSKHIKPIEISPAEPFQIYTDEGSHKDKLNQSESSKKQDIIEIQPSIVPSVITITSPPDQEPTKSSQDTVFNNYFSTDLISQELPVVTSFTIPASEELPIEENGDFNIFEDPEGTTDKCTDTSLNTPQKPSPSGKDYTLLDDQENKPPEGSDLPRQAIGDNIESQRVLRPLYSGTLDPSEGNNC